MAPVRSAFRKPSAAGMPRRSLQGRIPGVFRDALRTGAAHRRGPCSAGVKWCSTYALRHADALRLGDWVRPATRPPRTGRPSRMLDARLHLRSGTPHDAFAARATRRPDRRRIRGTRDAVAGQRARRRARCRRRRDCAARRRRRARRGETRRRAVARQRMAEEGGAAVVPAQRQCAGGRRLHAFLRQGRRSSTRPTMPSASAPRVSASCRPPSCDAAPSSHPMPC